MVEMTLQDARLEVDRWDDLVVLRLVDKDGLAVNVGLGQKKIDELITELTLVKVALS